jgi:hypothetical protein
MSLVDVTREAASPPPRLGEQEDIIVYSPDPDDPCGYFIAVWRDAEPEEFDGLDFGYGSTAERAAADLWTRFPRED